MGKVSPLARPSRSVPPETYPSVNSRPDEVCRTFIFRDDSNNYKERFRCVGVQYALGEERDEDWHIVTTPDSDGPLLRWLVYRPNGTICVMRHPSDNVCHCYRRDDLDIHGAVFQFVKKWGQRGRWEWVEEPDEGEGESVYASPYLGTVSSLIGVVVSLAAVACPGMPFG
jgi:hypothetical protein